MPNRKGFEPCQWPPVRPTGLDCYLVRVALGMSQRTMAAELQKAKRTIIEWERAGAALLVPDRVVAWRLAFLMLEAEDLKPRRRKNIAETYIRVNAGD